MAYDGQKRTVQFYNSTETDIDSSELTYVVIAATPQQLDEIGGLTFASGNRFPSDALGNNKFRFNKEVAQELMWIGLQLMGAVELSFDSSWFDSPDSNFHVSFEQDSSNKGHWFLHLEHPVVTNGTDGREIELDNDGTYIRWRYIGDTIWNNLVSIASLTGAPGADGSNGSDGSDGSNGNDGREIELRVSAGFIQWEYTTGDTWHNLIDVSDLVGAKGDKGDTGDKGDKGDTGDTGADGGNSPSDTPDLSPSSDTRCAVATECANELKRIFSSITNVNSTTRTEITSGTAGIGVIMAIIFPGAAVAIGVMGAAVGLYNTLLSIEANGYIPYFDSTILSEIQCQLYCLMDDSGKYDADVHAAWTSQIKDNPDGLHQAMGAVLDQAGYKPFQWAAISAPLLAAPDCDSCGCGWTSTFNFYTSDGGWSAWNDGGGDRAVWLSGIGWNENSLYKKSRMSIQFASFDSTKIDQMILKSTAGLSGDQHDTFVYYGSESPLTNGSTNAIVTIPGSTGDVTSIIIDIADDSNVNGRAVTGELYQIKLSGSGTKPSQFP